jgi:isoquinoline 1-oxidoreductase subunit alpha
MLMAAAALLKDKPKPTDADIDAAMTNICRCGTYNRVRAAIKQAAGHRQDGRDRHRPPQRSRA